MCCIGDIHLWWPVPCSWGGTTGSKRNEETSDWQDWEKGETKLFQRARRFYESVGDRLVGSGHALDVFACALDQVGLAEMRPAVSDSGAAFLSCFRPFLGTRSSLRTLAVISVTHMKASSADVWRPQPSGLRIV